MLTEIDDGTGRVDVVNANRYTAAVPELPTTENDPNVAPSSLKVTTGTGAADGAGSNAKYTTPAPDDANPVVSDTDAVPTTPDEANAGADPSTVIAGAAHTAAPTTDRRDAPDDAGAAVETDGETTGSEPGTDEREQESLMRGILRTWGERATNDAESRPTLTATTPTQSRFETTTPHTRHTRPR